MGALDATIESLISESGRRAADARIPISPPGSRIPPEVQAQRDAEAAQIRQREMMPNGGGAIPTSAVVQGSMPPSAAPANIEIVGSSKDFASDPVTAGLLAEATATPEGSRVEQIPGMAPQPQPKEVSTFDRVVKGPAEAALSMATGIVAAPVSQVAGVAKSVFGGKLGTQEGVRMGEERSKEIMEALTYRPRSEAGKEALGAVGEVMGASKLQGIGPPEGMLLAQQATRMGQARNLIKDMRGAGVDVNSITGKLRGDTPPPASPAPGGQFGSAGAAGASTAEQARALAASGSPETQALVAKGGGAVNLEALKRHIDAESLPVPVRLTKGQITQDVVELSNEQNLRGKNPAFAQRFSDQNKALVENTNLIREAVAPDVYVRSKPDVGDIVISAYRAKDEALNAAISAKYKALRDANGGQFPLDSKAFVSSADAALHKGLLYDFVPSELRATLNRVKDSGMTFENFESLRTNLARIQRSQTYDGNAKAAAGVIRNALEDLPMPPGAEHLKPIADAARAAAKERFDLIKADRAYKAVVDGKASADKFINQYVLKSDLKDVQAMKRNLANDPVAQQAIGAGVVDELKASAGIVGDTGNFSQAGYNKALEGLRPKIPVIFDPQSGKQIEALGSVARYTMAQPRGSFVNTSNTLTGAIAQGLKERTKSAAEGVGNFVAHGMPLGTWVRDLLERRSINKQVDEALKPGAGILLKDVRR